MPSCTFAADCAAADSSAKFAQQDSYRPEPVSADKLVPSYPDHKSGLILQDLLQALNPQQMAALQILAAHMTDAAGSVAAAAHLEDSAKAICMQDPSTVPVSAVLQDGLMFHISVLMDTEPQTAITACSALWLALSDPDVQAQLKAEGFGAQLDEVLLQFGGDSSQGSDTEPHVGGSADLTCADMKSADSPAEDANVTGPMPVASSGIEDAAGVDMEADTAAADKGGGARTSPPLSCMHAKGSKGDQDVNMTELALDAAADVNTAELVSGPVTLADLQQGLKGLMDLQILTAVASWRYGPLASASSVNAAVLLKHCLDPVHLWDTIDIAQELNLTLLEIAIVLKQLLPIAGQLLHHEQPPEAAARVDAITHFLDAQIAAG